MLNWLVAASKLHKHRETHVALLSGPSIHFLFYGSFKDQSLENRLKNRGDHLNVLYLVFLELSDDVSHLFLT